MLSETTTAWRVSRILEVENDNGEKMAGGRVPPARVAALLATAAGGKQ
jgi:hypothetical protein